MRELWRKRPGGAVVRPESPQPDQDAKARFSEFLDACREEGPQVVTKRGAETAVLVSIDEWRRLSHAAKPSLKGLMLSNEARTDFLVPARGKARRRRLPSLQ